MSYLEVELEEKIKEEIISLYEKLIGTIRENLMSSMGNEKAKRLFDGIAQGSGLLFIKNGQIDLRSLLKSKEKKEIIPLCNNIILSLVLAIGEKR